MNRVQGDISKGLLGVKAKEKTINEQVSRRQQNGFTEGEREKTKNEQRSMKQKQGFTENESESEDKK